MGGDQFLGWSEDRYIAAQTHDWLLLLASAWSGQKPSADDFWNLPKRPVVAEPEEVGTISEFSVPGFFGWLAGK